MGMESITVRDGPGQSWHTIRDGLWAALIILTLIPIQVQAHARLVRSNPSDQAVLTSTPKQIELWFNELLEEKFNSVELFTAESAQSKERVNQADGTPKIDRKDRTHMIVTLKPLSPGEYVVEWRVLSRDGHSAPGRIRFRVSAPK